MPGPRVRRFPLRVRAERPPVTDPSLQNKPTFSPQAPFSPIRERGSRGTPVAGAAPNRPRRARQAEPVVTEQTPATARALLAWFLRGAGFHVVCRSGSEEARLRYDLGEATNGAETRWCQRGEPPGGRTGCTLSWPAIGTSRRPREGAGGPGIRGGSVQKGISALSFFPAVCPVAGRLNPDGAPGVA